MGGRGGGEGIDKSSSRISGRLMGTGEQGKKEGVRTAGELSRKGKSVDTPPGEGIDVHSPFQEEKREEPSCPRSQRKRGRLRDGSLSIPSISILIGKGRRRKKRGRRRGNSVLFLLSLRDRGEGISRPRGIRRKKVNNLNDVPEKGASLFPP